MPFCVVQLAAFMKPSDEPTQGSWAFLRDAQLEAAQQDRKVGLAVTIDVGDADDIHPRNKREVGRRLALWALDAAYGQATHPGAGPVVSCSPASESIDGVVQRGMMVRFDGLGGALSARGGAAPDGFAVAGADGRFVWGSARLDAEGVFVWSPDVVDPVAVRYAWSNNPTRANLIDGRGLPIGPFRSDRPALDPACATWMSTR
jgi:sialate O-acetylesterase